MAKQLDIAIIGGGIAGITLAIALRRRGIPVKIYEQAHAFGEIGAGVAFNSNAVQAMAECDPGVLEAFNKVRTRNMWDSKQDVWFDYLDGFHPHGEEKIAFTIFSKVGQNGVHRAKFLDEMIHLLPPETSEFRKRLQKLVELDSGRVRLEFEDGTTAEHDAVIGCDGIKSVVRRNMFGDDHPCAKPGYSHKYAYRGLIPMDKAVQVLGEERAQNSCMHMGPGGHILTFPVNGGQTLNMVAFVTDPNDWTDTQKLTRPVKREDLLREFGHWNEQLTSLLALVEPDLDIWAIFDLKDHPPPAYAKGRVLIIGDAAHATSPHHGSGAGMAIEDSALLADLLADPSVIATGGNPAAARLSDVFAVFDAQRRDRGRFLVESSRFVGECYEWRGGVGGETEVVGEDFARIEREIRTRNGLIADVDVRELAERAKTELRARIN